MPKSTFDETTPLLDRKIYDEFLFNIKSKLSSRYANQQSYLLQSFIYIKRWSARNTQHHAAPRGTTQQHAAPRNNTQQYAATRSNTQQHAATRSNTQQHAAIRSNTHHFNNPLSCLTHISSLYIFSEGLILKQECNAGDISIASGGCWHSKSCNIQNHAICYNQLCLLW